MDRDRPRIDRDLRELLTYLRDTFRDAASRIDDYLLRQEGGRAPRGGGNDWQGRDRERPQAHGFREGGREGGRERDGNRDRDGGRDRDRDGNRDEHAGRDVWRGDATEARAMATEIHEPLERLREEVRQISNDAPDMEPALLRLHIEAVTAETRLLQARAADPVDQEIAARIMRALTAIVSDHRPGHVYGLARHHQTDWEEMARRARDEIRARAGGATSDERGNA